MRQHRSIECPLGRFESLESMVAWARDGQEALAMYAAAVRDAGLPEIISIPWGARIRRTLGVDIVPATLLDAMLQATSHSTYRRGQVNTGFVTSNASRRSPTTSPRCGSGAPRQSGISRQPLRKGRRIRWTQIPASHFERF